MNTLPAASGGCGMSGGGCSDAAVSGSSSSLPSVSATAGPAPIVYADEDTAKTASENWNNSASTITDTNMVH